MKTFLTLFAIITMILLSGCATRYPMGLDEKTWQTLPPAERARLQAEQAKIDAQLRLQRERDRHEERMHELQIEKEKQARITRLYQRAGFGDIVRVNIEGGCYRSYKKCEPYRPVSVILALGETKKVTLRQRYGNENLWIRYDEHGVTIDDDSNLDDFDAAVLLPERWERGRRYRLSLTDPYRKGKTTLTNATVFIRYFPTAVTTSNCR
jgi:hypothetical protein